MCLQLPCDLRMSAPNDYGVMAQANRRVACGVSLEELAPVMHVAETWEDSGSSSAVVRTSRCDANPEDQAVCQVFELVMAALPAKSNLHSTTEPFWLPLLHLFRSLATADSKGVCNHSVGTVTEEVLATPRSSHDGMRTPRPSSSGPAVEHLAVQVDACLPLAQRW